MTRLHKTLLLTIAALLVFVLCGGYVVSSYMTTNEASNSYEQAELVKQNNVESYEEYEEFETTKQFEVFDTEDYETYEIVNKETSPIQTEDMTKSNDSGTKLDSPIKPDFKKLEQFFPFYSFNYESENAGDAALNNLTWEFGCAKEFLNEEDVMEVFGSTTICGENAYSGYIRYSAKEVDELIRTVYNAEPSHKSKHTQNGFTYCVYDGDYYYRIFEINDWYVFAEVTNWVLNSDGTYTISALTSEFDCDPTEYYTIKAKPIMVNGKSYWSFYSVNLVSVVDVTYDWQDAYQDYLLEQLYVNGENSDAAFSLAYIDSDDIPELIYSDDSCHAASAKVLTFSNGKVIDLGNYGSYGEISYYEETEIISVTYSGMGDTTYIWYQKSGNNINKIAEASETIMSYDDLTGSDVYEYSVNGVETDKDTYEEYLESNDMFMDGTSAGRDYSLTEANIYAYCN